MQEDRLHLSLELTEVVGFLRGIADSFHDVAQGKGVALRFAPQCKRWEVFVDRGFLDKIVYELLNNAIKYTPDGGRIVMSAGADRERVWLEVADNGIGIPDGDRERIFERFYRVDKARSRESGGTGLGLSIAQEIIRQHEGSLSLVERSGPGTTLRMELKREGPKG